MSVCASCGHQNQSGAKFCSECGAALVAVAPALRQERKIVTVLFADLVGFTSTAERMDPEDVRALLSPYYARLRSELEHYGGAVEKFIGDAVVALFGAPRAHEDDPERAVRAALAIRAWVRDEERLQVRIAVNTGEALVTLGARLAEGEGMAAGDVVNTTARLQNAAPVNGILVGGSTYRATRSVIAYREAAPVEAKGKSGPVLVWEAVEALAHFGVDVPHEARTGLVGRARELGVVRDALQRVREEHSPQLVTLVGVPGIGKSRLLYELSQIVDADPELISWRQGRSLPYGEGVSFWALAEMVKAQAGILESDAIDQAEAKLARAVADVVAGQADLEWVRRHLCALIGVSADAPGTDRSEVFNAWRRFFEALAEQRPLVLVFEDLHWADDGLLDFVDHLVDWAAGVPILVVASARPELLERRPGWGGGKANATTLSLSPLSDDDTARLIGLLLGRPLLEAGEQHELVLRAGGNPLYAEQYTQMLAERGGGAIPDVPESIQGIIGARLDSLAPDEKRLLQDAAVIGKVFWPGAVAALDGGGGERSRLDASLHALERKQFVRRERQSSVAEETQYAFLHLLLRDVAYGQIPRAGRVERHVLAARWLESLGRLEDHAEMLGYHYSSALELARAAQQDIAAIAPGARAALRAAGDRVRALNAFPAAVHLYQSALELWPEEARRERADLLFRLALAKFGAADADRTLALEAAHVALLDVGDEARAAEVDSVLAQVWWLGGRHDLVFEHLERGRELVRDAPASVGKARLLSQFARYRMLDDTFDPAQAQEALQLAEYLGLDEIQAHTLITIGSARFRNDGSGRADIERGLELALAGNWWEAVVRAYSNLADQDDRHGRLRDALHLAREAERAAERLGSDQRRWARGNLVGVLLPVGEWDECSRVADEFIAESEQLGPHYLDAAVLGARARLRLARGDERGALDDQAEALERARLAKDPQILYPVLGVSAYVLAEAARVDESRALLDELLQAPPGALNYGSAELGDVIWTACVVDRRDEVRRALPPNESPWLVAARAALDGDFAGATAIYDDAGAMVSAALARLRGAELLVSERRRAEADADLATALAFFRSVGATRYTRAGEALLAASA